MDATLTDIDGRIIKVTDAHWELGKNQFASRGFCVLFHFNGTLPRARKSHVLSYYCSYGGYVNIRNLFGYASSYRVPVSQFVELMRNAPVVKGRHDEEYPMGDDVRAEMERQILPVL